MDGDGFDSLTRFLAEGSTRRRVLRAGMAVVGSAFGLGRLEDAGAAKSLRKPGQVCRKKADCTTQLCGALDRHGRGRCLCSVAADCPQPKAGDPCRAAACSESGVCGTGVNVGAVCDDNNACTTGDVCDERGRCTGDPVVCPPVANGSSTCNEANGQCATVCDPSFTLCQNACLNLNTDMNNCGACGTVCPAITNASPVCSQGQCSSTCLSGFADCNQNAGDGCETNLLSDRNNCGACNNICPTTGCNGGQCKAALAEVCSTNEECLSGGCFEQRCIPLIANGCPASASFACFDNGLEIKWCCGAHTESPQCSTSDDCAAGWLCRTTGAYGRTCWQIPT